MFKPKVITLLIATLSTLTLVTLAANPLIYVPLTFQEQSYQYTANISIGTPPQSFNLVVDTGSWDAIWVIYNDCNNCTNTVHFFNSSRSSTFQHGSKKDTMNSVDFVCEIDSDTVILSGIKLPNFQFGLCSRAVVANSTKKAKIFDGILGLDLQSDYPSLSQALIKSSRINDNSFALHLGLGQLIFGGADYTLNATAFKYYPLTSTTDWEIMVNQVSFGNVKFLAGSTKAMFDSYYPYIVCPWQFYQNLMLYIGQSSIFDCSISKSLPDIQFQIGSNIYSLFPKDYIYPLREIWSKSNLCSLAFQGYNIPDVGFIFGQNFMRKFYLHFDSPNNRIGIAAIH